MVSAFDDVELHQKLIAEECENLKELLLEKNRSYGSSFAKSGGEFSPNLNALDKLHVRMQDKLERIRNVRDSSSGEDTYADLAGYIILRKVLIRLEKIERARENEP